ncbi:MAG: type II secretion system protein [Candidatus Uhrbacteria bacterium]
MSFMRHSKYSNVFRQAFTLIELLVVIAIFAVLTTFLLANFRVGKERSALRDAATLIVSDIQRLQLLALSGDTRTPGAVAYGIHFDAINHKSSYILFADQTSVGEGNAAMSPNGRYDFGEELPDGTVNLPTDVVIAAVDLSDSPSDSVDVLFRSPRGDVVVSSSLATMPLATIVHVALRHRSGGDDRILTINGISGQVNVR